MSDDSDSVRGAVAQAWTEASDLDDGDGGPPPAAPAPAPSAPPVAPREPPDAPPGQPEQEASAPSTPPPTPTAPGEPPDAPPVLKAPQSWRPEVREHWAGLPPAVQHEVARRERQVMEALQQTAPARRQAEALEATLQPYRHLIQGDPLQVLGGLLRTASVLQTGAPAERAELLASIIRQHGVPIEELDRALTSKPQPAAPRDARVDALLAREQAREHQSRLYEQAQARAHIEAFRVKAEFLDDVAPVMADLMDGEARRGVDLPLEEAYARACQADPRIRAVLAQRAQAQAATAANAATQQARRAGMSVRSSPAAAGPARGGESLRDTILAAWGQVGE